MEYLQMVVSNTLSNTIYKDIPVEEIIKELPSTVESANHLQQIILTIAARVHSKE